MENFALTLPEAQRDVALAEQEQEQQHQQQQLPSELTSMMMQRDDNIDNDVVELAAPPSVSGKLKIESNW